MDFTIINERPEGVSIEDYHTLLKEQKQNIKLHLKGTYLHISCSLIPKLGKDGKIVIPVQWLGKTKGETYVKPVEVKEDGKD